MTSLLIESSLHVVYFTVTLTLTLLTLTLTLTLTLSLTKAGQPRWAENW